ncbi:hypothetical protein [Muriicola soli]|uniref:Uncharacterized protein n=1 Tax=Muriicola soli TaxID=2507538 RepID=A0A411E7A0_9FLAO|nr:hypothetical protein [Muriicola soli]QBA63569.1 hypothetical protein EQY75_02795 [Muriicola soli]
MDKKILLLLFLVSGFAFSQTTVNLQDQCNCEVLSGTAVTSPGTTTPSGADTGDIYVNTNTGVIYFWDGDSWELTSSDDQQLQNFSFNAGTNILSLDIEDGNTVTVDLSSLSSTGTDDQALSLAGNILTLEDGGTVDLTPFLDNTDDQIITAFSIDASNILTLTLENGNTQTVDLSGLVGTDDQTAAEVTYDNTTSGLTATDVQAAIDEINALAGTVALVDNGDGTYDFTDAAGNTTIISDTSISTMVDNLDGTYTYTDETGATQVIDTNASSNPYDNTTSGLTATDVQAAIDEINALAGTVALVDNGDGTYDFTDAAGNTTIISDTSISTLVDNLDGTYTYTDETGATQVIDTNASSNPYDNTTSGLTATDVQAAIDEINALAGTVALVDNGDGTYDFTDAAGNTTIISDTSISTLVDNLDGTYTYTDETGATQVIDTNASSNPYDNTTSGLTATDVQAAIDEINALAGTVALVDNGDGTYDFTDAAGNTTIISDTSISTLVDNLDGTYTYTDETGATQVIDTNASSNPYDNTTSGLTATDVQAAIDEINALAGTVALVDNGDGTYDFTDAAGNTTIISDTSISTLVDNLDGTYTYTDETGATQVIDTNASSNPYDNTTSGLTATDVQAAIDEINALAGTVALVDNGDGTYDFTDAAGNTTIISDTSISTLVDNLDGTYTYTDETGATQVIDTNASSNPYDNTTSGLTATDVQAAIDEINALAGTVALVDNGDGTYDFTDAAGNTTIISDTSISTMVDNLDGTYTYTDETGATQVIDTNASSNPYDNTTSGLTATDVQAAIDEINALAGTVALVDNGDGTYDFTDAAGNTTIISDTSISTMVDNLDGTYTYTDETGATQVIDTNASSNPYDNTTSGLTATDVQAAIDEINALAGTVALVDNLDGTYTFTDASGSNTTISDTSISTLVNNGDATFTYTDETGTPVTIDLISADANNDIIAGSDGGLYLNVASVAVGETITNIADNGDGTFTYTNENGIPQTINKADVTDNVDGTYTFDNNDGTPVTISTTAASNPYDNTTSGLTATDVQAAIDEVSAGSTDDQNISGSGLAGTNLTIGIENGASEVVDLSSLVGTDDQIANEVNITDAGGNFTSTEVEGALAELAAGSTDDQNISGSGLAGTNLTIGIENGASEVVDLSSLVGTDDQTAAEVTYDNTTSGLTAVDVQAAIDEVAAGSTDDQNISGSGLAGTNLTIGIENGASEVVDLSSLVGTDDQDLTGASLSGANILQIDIENGSSTTVDLSSLDDSGTDDQNISGSGLAGTNLTIGIENGASEVVDLSSLVGTDDQTAAEVTYDNTTSGLTAVDIQAAIDEVAAGSTDDQNISGSGLAGTNLTIGIENGASEVVDLSSLVGTDDQIASEVNITDAGGNFTSTEVEGALAELAAGSTDDQNISGSGLAGTNLTIGIENGASEVVDLSSLVGTDDQTAAEVTYDNTTSGLTAVDVQAAIDEVAAGSTDDQNISGSGLAGTNLTIGIENGASEVVDLSSLVGTDDQNLSTDSTPGNISIEDGNSLTLNVDDADADATNEFNTALGMNAGALEVTDAGGTLSTSLISTDANNDISSGSDGALYLNVASVTISETITNIADNGDGTFTYTNENGVPQTISKADVTDNTDGTYTFDNNDGSPVTISTTAASNPYDNTTSGLTATDVQAAIDEVAGGSTDDQNISGSGLAGTNLTIGIENGTSEVVDLSSLVGTDDQIASEVNITDAGGNFTSTEVEGALAELAAGSTDDQNISGSGLAGTNLTIGIENGASEVVDLSSLVGTDDQDLTGASLSGANILQIDIENGASTTVDLSSLDDSGTDDQNISGSGLAGTNLTIGIENGTSEVVDLSSLVGTDDQTAAEVTYDNTTSGLTAVDVQAAIDEVAAGSTDDQDISGSGLAGTNLTIGIENGASEVVDLSSLVGSDDQNISGSGLAGTNLTIGIENGTSEVVDLSSLVGTDDQNLTGASLSGANVLQIDIENGASTTVDLSSLDDSGTDDQNISGSGLAGTNLTIGIENGTSEVVDLSSLVGTDDQTAAEVTYDNTTSGLTAVDVQAAIDEVAAGSTDDQDISGSGLAGTNLTIGIENGASEVVDLSSLVGSDDQNISGSGLAGTNLTIGIENGTSEVVDLSSLVGTDDQIASEVNITDAGGNFTSTEVEGALAELAAGSTDDQDISGSGLAGTNLTIGIENGASEVVDLSSLVGTDDQDLTGASLSGANILQIDIENGASTTVDLSSLDDSGTDDQNISGSGLAGTNLTIGIENGTSEVVDLSSLVGTDDQTAAEVTYDNTTSGLTAVDVQAAIDEVAAGSTDDQDISGSGLAGTNLTIGIENGASEVVDLSSLVGSDDQNISGSGLAGTNLTIGIENGTSEVVDLSSLVGTDDQIASEVNITDAGGNFTSTEVEGALAELAAGSTDDQNISGSGLAGTNLTIGIENGTSEVVDLSSLVGTDDQTAAEVTYDNTTSGLTAVDVQAAIDEVAAGSTDDQDISGSGLAGTNLTIGIENGASEVVDLSSLVGSDDQNISGSGLAGTNLTIGIENGTSEVVDLSSLVGTDDQDLTGASLSGANILQIDIENGASTTVDLSSLDDSGTDDQNISGSGLAGTNLTIGIENGTSEVVDLSSLVGTDDQIASEVNITDAGGNFTSTEVEGALAELAAGSTDDQNISGSGLAGTNLTIGIENGTSEVVDLSSLVGTDDQTAAEVTYDNTTSGLTAVDVQAAIDEVAAGSTDDQDISGSGLTGTNLTIGIENGASEVVDLSSLVGSDDQNISGSGLAGTNLTIGIENGTSEVVDLSSLVGTDDQNLTGASLSGANILQIDIENGASTTVDLSSLDDSGTDDQNIESLAVDTGTNILTVGIEDGTSQTVDLSHLDDNGTDDQYDDEVPLRTPIDVDEGGAASPTNETNVEEVIQAIAPITSKAARIFYPPSIAIDASTNGVGYTVDLYQQYLDQYGNVATSNFTSSAGAPATVPTYVATDLYYYVTYADPTVFANLSINASGVLTYDIIGQPSDYNSLINVVFVVK